jgi:flagellar biosynthesis/type III secretory pathway M-ring protein FliF/YscJ
VVVLAMLVWVMMRNRKTGATVEAREALPAMDTYGGLPAANTGVPGAAAAIGEPSRLPALMPSRTEVLLGQLTENSRNNAEAWANVLRGWLAEEESH